MEKKECSSAEVDHSSPKDEFQELLQTLEHQTNWDGQRLVKYDGIWLLELLFRPILSAQKYFKAKDTDVILSTMPKSGTTWLKALTFSIANRSVFPIDRSPLLTSNPHKVVPALEFNLYWGKGEKILIPKAFPNQEFCQPTSLSKSFRIPSVNPTVELSTSAETLWMYSSHSASSCSRTRLQRTLSPGTG
ncbi:UNVERIFIED_CONTAM: Cytosolic sulfotransferase 17 [Sesamum radiatum]|uniref:Sulfotransferase n=1 Tax=Sesamum radiatum TaxID=300843 RepID=A0AAW2JRT2_SESRA